MIPLTVDVPMKRWPWANCGLIVTTVILSLAVPATREEVDFSQLPQTKQSRPDDLPFTINVRHTYSPLVLQRHNFAAHQLVTALFQHAGLLHLIGNLLFLFVFGNAIDAKLGHIGFLVAYLGIGSLVNLVWLLTGSHDACLGASAAIMGMCGMFLVLYPFNTVQVYWNEFQVGWMLRDWTGEIPGWVAVLLFMAFDAWGALFNRNAGIGYVSHLLGCLLGIALAVFLLQVGWLSADRGEQTLVQRFGGQGPVEDEKPLRRKRRKQARPSSLRDWPGK